MAPGSDAVPNFSLQGHRRRLDLTQEQVAEELVRLAWEHHGVRVGADAQMVSKWERGEKRPSRLYRELLCLLYCATQEQLGFRQPEAIMEDGGHDELGQLSNALEDDLNRRDLIRNAATLGAAVLAPFDWLSQRAPKPTGEPAEIAAVRDALMRYDSLESSSHMQVRPVSLPVLRRRLDRAWAAFQSSRYSMLGSQLPRLLTATQQAVKELDGDEHVQACGLLAEAYQLAAAMLLKLGDSNSAWVAADRGVLAAEQAEDRLVVASAARILAYAFIDAGHFGKAKDLTVAAADALEDDLSSSPAHLSLYGALLQKGAMAAAYQGDRITSRALLGEADAIARRVGGDANHWFTAFGPTNVKVHRVSAAVVLGDGGVAVQHAKSVHPIQLPVLERRALFLVDVGRGYGQWNKDDEALRALLTAEQLAPEGGPLQPRGPHPRSASAAPGASRSEC